METSNRTVANDKKAVTDVFVGLSSPSGGMLESNVMLVILTYLLYSVTTSKCSVKKSCSW